MLKTKTPKDIENYSFQDIVNFIQKSSISSLTKEEIFDVSKPIMSRFYDNLDELELLRFSSLIENKNLSDSFNIIEALNQIPSFVNANTDLVAKQLSVAYLKASSKLPLPGNRMKIIKAVFEALGYDLSPDLALALCAEPKAQLVISTAGGGKTTGAQIKAILEKIWRPSSRYPNKKISGDKILCLVYNKHNVKPMEDKHKKLVSRLKMSKIKDLDIDDEINASTMHAFCDQIRIENVARMGLIGFRLQEETEAHTLMKLISTKITAQHKLKLVASVNDLLSLYNYARESMLSLEALQENDKFLDIKLPLNVLDEIFKLYDKMKKMKRRYDYVDMLLCTYDLLSTYPDVLKDVQKYFEYIIADEIQDFTPIMMSILQLFVSNGTPLMCIGDEDQGIYNFRGADIYNTLDFEKKFDGGEVYSLVRNRRCRKKILDYAKYVISENTIRYDKEILGIKDGGNIEVVPYTSLEAENIKVANQIAKLSDDELNKTVACYRDRNSSIMLTEILADMGVPFYVLSGYLPYSHVLYSDLISVFNALESPFDKRLSLSLYKVLPIKKDKLKTVFNYDETNHRFRDDVKQHFASYDYGDAMQISGFADVMSVLKNLSFAIQNKYMDEIFPIVFKLLSKYHWNYLKRERERLAVYDNYIESKVDKIFNQHKRYSDVYDEFAKKSEVVKRNNVTKTGVAISTFHSLKGLEFNNCFLIDLDNDIFPNYSLIDAKPYSENTKQALKECETRLFYVAVTRAIDNLYLYYAENNPSRYVYALLKADSDKIFNQEPESSMSILDERDAESTTEIKNGAEDLAIDECDEIDDFFEGSDVSETLDLFNTANLEDMTEFIDIFDDTEIDDDLNSHSSPEVSAKEMKLFNESPSQLNRLDIEAPKKASSIASNGYLNKLLQSFGG